MANTSQVAQVTAENITDVPAAATSAEPWKNDEFLRRLASGETDPRDVSARWIRGMAGALLAPKPEAPAPAEAVALLREARDCIQTCITAVGMLAPKDLIRFPYRGAMAELVAKIDAALTSNDVERERAEFEAAYVEIGGHPNDLHEKHGSKGYVNPFAQAAWLAWQLLKDCPFCGGEARVVLADDEKSVECGNCGAASCIGSEGQAIAAWNRRRLTGGVVEAAVARLRAEADNVYCRMIDDATRKAEILGEDHKLASGAFGKAELIAHRESAKQQGFYSGVHKACREIEAALTSGGKAGARTEEGK